MGKKLMDSIVKLIKEHNATHTEKVAGHLILLLNKNEERLHKYNFDVGIEPGKTLEDNRKLVNALCMSSCALPQVFRLVMNAATAMSDPKKFTIHRPDKNKN